MTRESPASAEARLEAIEQAVERLNEAVFGFAGIASRMLVEEGCVGRTELAEAIERRAGPPGQPDHNPLLLAFARAVRMNLPGGRFEVIEGGRSDLDPTGRSGDAASST